MTNTSPSSPPSETDNEVFALLGRKWATQIMWALKGRTVRFNALRAELEGISAKSLAEVLKELHRNGLVDREVFPVIPPRVDYRLTTFGEGLVGILQPFLEARK